MSAPKPEWRIHPSGVRHAIVTPGDRRYACNEPVLDPRFAGSDQPKSWCDDCVAATGLVVSLPHVPAWSESELRHAHGDR